MAQESNVISNEEIRREPSLSTLGSKALITAGTIVAPKGKVSPNKITSPKQFLTEYTLDGKSIPRSADITLKNAYRLSLSQHLVLTRATSTVLVACISNGGLKFFKKGNIALLNNFDINVTIGSVSNTLNSTYSFVIGGYCFYKGTIPTISTYTNISQLTLVDLGTDPVATILSTFEASSQYHILGDVVVGEGDSSFTFTLLTSIDLTIEEGDVVSHGMTATEYTQTSSVDPETIAFYVSLNSPMATDSYTFKSNVDGIYKVLTINGVDYPYSLTPGFIDNNGSNIFLEYLNRLTDLDFKVTLINPEASVANVTETAFGAVTMTAPTVEDRIAALDRVVDQENFTYDHLTDFGFANVQYQKALESRGAQRYNFIPITIPSDITDPVLVKAYRNSLEIDNGNMYALVPNDINSSILGYETIFSAATLYLERIAANKAANSEFAPVMKTINGRMSATELVRIYTKPEREFMLDSKVNTIKYEEATGLSYANDIFTLQTDNNILGEENNRRLHNKLRRELTILYQQFLGMQNNKRTRDSVVDITKLYFENFIENQLFTIDDKQIICDESNNNSAIITANKLAVTVSVRYFNAIKFIEVLNRAFSLGTNF
jgi:hypothetical protein